MENIGSERKPWSAFVLSLLSIGLGHVYCGRLATGLALNLLAMAPAFLAVILVATANATTMAFGILMACVIGPVIYLCTAIDAFILAKKIGKQYILKDYNRGIVYALFIGGGVATGTAICPLVVMNTRANIVEAFACVNESMNPTLMTGDLFLVNKLQQRKQPTRGDIVVFLSPENRETRYVKRVVALPGDVVQVCRDGRVLINGSRLDQPCAPNLDVALPATPEEPAGESTVTVPPGHCYVLGDNRSYSKDSRKFGCVPLGDVLGRAELIYYPFSRWTRLGRAEP